MRDAIYLSLMVAFMTTIMIYTMVPWHDIKDFITKNYSCHRLLLVLTGMIALLVIALSVTISIIIVLLG